tara:strand:+ start:239 stop:595 length:357 start_codon:yes stop_codon:yes gene_type:complete
MRYLLGALLLLLPFSSSAESPTFFRTVAPIQALCVMGGPQPIIEELLSKYNEKPVHALMVTPTIQMYITENCNNPSSTLFLHNSRVNQTCIFWSANDCLNTIETESLPAKTPEDNTDT